jgi:hypothetical protein
MDPLSFSVNPCTFGLLLLALVLTAALFVDWKDWFTPIGCVHCGAPTGDERYRCPECGKPIHPDGVGH